MKNSMHIEDLSEFQSAILYNINILCYHRVKKHKAESILLFLLLTFVLAIFIVIKDVETYLDG
jgi:hypothetical protein